MRHFLLPCLCALLASCAALTARDAATIETIDAAACSALTLIPIVGTVAALACPGEEALLAGALGAAVAASARPDAGQPASTAAAAPRVAVHRRHGRGRVRVGYVPAELAAGCQAALDATAAEAGAQDASAEAGR